MATANIEITAANQAVFSNASIGDVVFYTGLSNQNIIIGASNAYPMMTITSNAIGISKSNPNYTLDIIGDVNFTGTLRQAGAPYVVNSQWANSNNNLYIISSNVGIGKSNPSYMLDITGDLGIGGDLYLTNKSLIMNGVRITKDLTGAPANMTSTVVSIPGLSNTSASNLDIFSACNSTNNYVRIMASTSEIARFSATGNVGIGTTNPAYKLDVNGPWNLAYGSFRSAYHSQVLTSSDANTMTAQFAFSSIAIGKVIITTDRISVSQETDYYAEYEVSWYKGTSVTPQIICNKVGQHNKGYAITTTVYFDSINGVLTFAVARSVAGTFLFNCHVFGEFNIPTVSKSSTVPSGIVITSSTLQINAVSNRVGLAMASDPNYTLDVAGDVNLTGSLRSNGAIIPFNQWSTINSNTYIGTNSNVGIGTSIPAYPLDIVGDVNLTGSLRSNGTAVPLGLWKNNSSSVYVGLNSNIGIGTTTPAFPLSIAADMTLSTTNIVGDPNQAQMYIGGSSTGKRLAFLYDTTKDFGAIQAMESGIGSKNLVLQLAGGSIGIGKSNPSYTVDVNGDIYASGDITALSDARYKKNIEPITNALSKLEQISGYTYELSHNNANNKQRHAGVIAQEIEKILPEVIYENQDGEKSVAYGNLTALLIESIKELKRESRIPVGTIVQYAGLIQPPSGWLFCDGAVYNTQDYSELADIVYMPVTESTFKVPIIPSSIIKC